MTNAEIARAIDPGNEQGWFIAPSQHTDWQEYYTGPDFTLRSEAWRMEDFILSKSHEQYAYTIQRMSLPDSVHTNVWALGKMFQDTDHNAALIAAIGEIANGR
jgi:hypothetical protein